MKKDTFISMRVSDEEKQRLEVLAGEQSLSAFLLSLGFSAKRVRGNEEEYPGWEVIERGRRDRGIKIAHASHKAPVILYPEDDAYLQFEE